MNMEMKILLIRPFLNFSQSKVSGRKFQTFRISSSAIFSADTNRCFSYANNLFSRATLGSRAIGWPSLRGKWVNHQPTSYTYISQRENISLCVTKSFHIAPPPTCKPNIVAVNTLKQRLINPLNKMLNLYNGQKVL